MGDNREGGKTLKLKEEDADHQRQHTGAEEDGGKWRRKRGKTLKSRIKDDKTPLRERNPSPPAALLGGGLQLGLEGERAVNLVPRLGLEGERESCFHAWVVVILA